MQPPLAPEQAFGVLQFMLPALKNEHRTTMRVIEAIPVDRGDYRPEPVAKSALDLAWHIAVSEKRFYDGVLNGQFDFTGGQRPESIKNSREVAAWYAHEFDSAFNRLTQASGDQLAKIVDFRGVLQLPAVHFLRLGLCHSIHHRGQLSVYLRPMGSKVPSIYGESYDDAQARKAAQAQSSNS